MHAVVMTSAGGPEVLRVEELPEPAIQHDTEILVRLKAAGINPIDTKVRRNPEAHPIDLPAVLGCDGAGVVEAVGAGVEEFKRGDEVYFSRAPTRGHAGTYAQRVVIDERSAARKPASLSFVDKVKMVFFFPVHFIGHPHCKVHRVDCGECIGAD